MASAGRVLAALYVTMDRLVDQELTGLLADWSLSATQYQALRYLRHQGGAELAELARALSISPPAASKLADRLQQGEWIARQPIPEDRRKTRLALTPRAEEMLSSLQTRVGSLLLNVQTRLQPEEQAALLAGAAAFLREGLQRLPGDRPCLYCGQQHEPDCPLFMGKKRPPADAGGYEE